MHFACIFSLSVLLNGSGGRWEGPAPAPVAILQIAPQDEKTNNDEAREASSQRAVHSDLHKDRSRKILYVFSRVYVEVVACMRFEVKILVSFE